MDVLDPLLADDAEAWVSALPQYQQDIVLSFLDQHGDPAVAATQWLTASGPSHTFPFGGKKPEAIFYDKLLAEVEAFLCSDDRYEKERSAFLAEFDSRQAYVVGSVSAIVAPAVGSAAAIIAPAIALIFVTLGKMGLRAWCGMRAELQEEAGTEDQNNG